MLKMKLMKRLMKVGKLLLKTSPKIKVLKKQKRNQEENIENMLIIFTNY